MFSSEFCGIFKKIFSYKTSPVAASEPSAPTTNVYGLLRINNP